LLSQAKVSKKKATLCRLVLALLIPVGGNRTRPSSLQKPQATAELKQAIAENSHFHCATRRDSKGDKVKTISLRHSRETVKVFPVEYTS
jgi:hypothetical protein